MLDALSFATPAGAWSFLAVAAVAALYFFHRRYRPQRVTGLFLWGAPCRDTAGGRTRESLVRSSAFWFDCAAAALLALALTAPRWTARERTSVLLLDNAFAMRSNGNHEEAARIAAEVAAASRQTAIVIVGKTPRIAKPLAPASAQDFTNWLETHYSPAEPESDIPRAAAFAKEVYGANTDLHIITNQAGADRFAASGATVHTLAGQGGNLAFHHIWRRKGNNEANEEILFLGIENFGEATEATLSVDTVTQTRHLAAGTTNVEIPLADSAQNTLRITLTANVAKHDSIALDSFAAVPPAPPGRPGVAVTELPDESLRAAEAALRAAGCTIVSDPATADLLVTGNTKAEGRTATLRFVGESAPALARAPFRIDAASALCRDLDLSDALWPVANRDHAPRPDEIFIEVGDTPLYWREGERSFFLNLLPARGNFARTPAWPVLLLNLSARVESLRPEARPATDGLPLYGKASDARTLSPRAEVTQDAAREDETTGTRDLRWPLFLAAAALLGYNYYASARNKGGRQ